MKQAVAVLTPWLEEEKSGDAAQGAGTVVLATVKGDVHDIGKNIVSVVLQCNGFKVIDLGVMVPTETILDAVETNSADLLGLSGLITPSLDEMVRVAEEMDSRGITVPLLIGGATTSPLHTAVKIAPVREQAVLHVLDASRAPGAAAALLNPRNRSSYIREQQQRQQELRERYRLRDVPLIPLDEARQQKLQTDWANYTPPQPLLSGVHTLENTSVAGIIPYINWSPFFWAWELRGHWQELLQDPVKGEQAQELYDDAQRMLEMIIKQDALHPKAVWGLWPAAADVDDVVLYDDSSHNRELGRFCCLRQQLVKTSRPEKLCLSDYVAPAGSGVKDWAGAFAVSAGHGLQQFSAQFLRNSDDYSAILAAILADRLAEALTELLHLRIRREFWGYSADEQLTPEELFRESYRGIRPAPGYPACPDHTEKRTIFALLDAEARIGVSLTESDMMVPTASVSGYLFSHPQSSYFGINRIGRDQLAAYAARKGWSEAEAERRLGRLL